MSGWWGGVVGGMGLLEVIRGGVVVVMSELCIERDKEIMERG